MKMCALHWDDLKQGLMDRDMWSLVASSDRAAVDRYFAEADDPRMFDPLMAAYWQIQSAALEVCGMELRGGSNVRERDCSLCEVIEHGEDADEWIRGCLDVQLAQARKLGLMPRVQ